MKKLTEQKGFTVGELLIVVAIVAVLVAIALPTFTAQLASAKEAVDDANCRSAQAAATTVCLTDCHGDFSKKTLEEWIQIALADGIPKNGQADPTSTLNCQIESNNHLIKFFYGEGSSAPTPDNPGTNPNPDNPTNPGETPDPDVPTTPDTPDVPDNPNDNPTNTYPGTNLPVSTDVWPPQDTWSPEDPWKEVVIKPSGIFLYEGKYYVVANELRLDKNRASLGPGSYGAQNTVELTGRIITDWDTNTSRYDLHDGDICQVGGRSYVFINHSSYGPNPAFFPDSGEWYKLP